METLTKEKKNKHDAPITISSTNQKNINDNLSSISDDESDLSDEEDED